MTSQINPTHLTTAAELDGLSGAYDFQPEIRVDQIVKEFAKIMGDQYNLTVWYDDIESMINAIGLDEVTPEGRFATRFIKQWKKRNRQEPGIPYYPFKPVQEAGAVIGDIYKQVIARKPATLYWRITSDISGILENPGRTGGYGNPDSCWFSYGGMWSNSPQILEQARGAALLLGTAQPVNVDNGVGRCFLVNGEDGLVLFNPYLNLNDGVNRNRAETSRFFADLILKSVLQYTPQAGENPGGYYTQPETGAIVKAQQVYINTPNGMYINDSRGYIISDETDPQAGDPFDGCSCFICERCGRDIDEGDQCVTPNGEILCSDCFYERYTTCENCEETILIEDSYADARGQVYCESCFNRLFTSCDDCGDPVPNAKIIEDYLGWSYCEACYPDHHIICDDCGDEICIDHEPSYDDNGETLCESCHNDREARREREAQPVQEEQPEPPAQENPPAQPESEVAKTIQCEGCGNRIPRGESKIDRDGYIYCSDCYLRDHATCTDCNREISRWRDPVYYDSGDTVCQPCQAKRTQRHHEELQRKREIAENFLGITSEQPEP